MTDVQIDLGEVRPIRVSEAPVPYRALFGAVALLLVAMLGGAAGIGSPAAPSVFPAKLGDDTFVSGDRLFLVGSGRLETGEAVRYRTITVYRLPDLARLGTTTVSVPGSVMQVVSAGPALLVGYQISESGFQAVLAMADGTDRQLWQRNARLVGASPADGIALLSDDHAHYAVDLTTGALRWTVPHPADGFVTEAGFEHDFLRWLVVVTDSGRLEVRDAHTGRPVAAVQASRLGGRANGMIWPTADLLLVDTGAGFDGYRLPDLTRRWHTTVDLSESWMQADCGPAICTYHRQRGMTALDPATGLELWRSDRWAYAEPAGRYLLATANDALAGGPRVSVIDPGTGAALGDFGAWQSLGPAGDGTVYGTRPYSGPPGRYRTLYGVLDPATRHVRVLGTADDVSGGCLTAGGVLICRLIGASVGVWRLR